MKITEMTTDQAADAMIRISSAAAFICEDQEVLDMVDELQSMGDTPVLEAITKLLPKLTRLALAKHRDSLYEIIGALTAKDKKAVSKMKFADTVGAIRENWDELKDFFTSFDRSTEPTVAVSA